MLLKYGAAVRSATKVSIVLPDGLTLPVRMLPSALKPVWPGPGARMTALMLGYSLTQPSSMALDALMTTMTLSNSLVTFSTIAVSRVVSSR